MFPRLRARLRLSLGTAVLLALVAGLSVGVYVLSERARQAEELAAAAESRAQAAESANNRTLDKLIDPFLKYPNNWLNWQSYGKVIVMDHELRETMLRCADPNLTGQDGSLLVFGSNLNKYTGLNSPKLCFYNLDPFGSGNKMFGLDPQYRIEIVRVAEAKLSVKLTRVELGYTISAEVPLPQALETDSEAVIWALEREFSSIDIRYTPQYPEPTNAIIEDTMNVDLTTPAPGLSVSAPSDDESN